MSEKILVVGGVALGPKAACRCKRLMPDAEVMLVDENVFISYGGCGIPYYVSGEIQNLDDLRSTPYHTVRDTEFFRDMKGITVRTQTRALAIDRAAKTLLVKDVVSGKEEKLPYDKLVLATGASPRVPPIEGKDLKNVLSLTRLEAAGAIRAACQEGKVSEAVIVGGGFIGLEAAVALADMWGVKVSVVEMMDQILPGVLSQPLSLMAANDCLTHKVDVFTSEKVLRLEGENGTVTKVVTDKREIPAQLVIFAAGFIPNGQLAKDAGLEVAPFGAVVVDEHMRTTDPSIYAGGDCVAIKNIITGKIGYLPLGSMANRQGRTIGTNLAGGNARFPGFVGTWAVKLFDLSFCGVGLTVDRARKEGFDAMSVSVEQLDHAHFYPEKAMMSLELVVDKATSRVLGIQGACADPDSLKARIDAVAAALQYSKPTVEDISNLEIAYAPPFASAMDVVNVVANVADNALSGRFTPVTADQFMDLWKKRSENHVFFIDARPAAAGKAVQEKYPDWHAMPLEEIAARISEVPKDRPVAIICNTGLRAYDSLLVLARNGVTNVVNSTGGMQAAIKMGLSL
ncbi:FAD-dependent oxidoreductase [Desulfovibrio desulfuricans]|uniref:FAD-dependent pyridine nucleotide-disulphide oxidoreductase n=2 Tax=Desulfovibrio TaxID=872 RepID=A0A212K0B3_9BACT|nr:FAD-dependent oxidoreductase [Desulfovibrio desulfuricans]MBD8895957.1 FAD-dependent oxidoreductase [Desulfovibrio desulfuricans]MCB6541200.1 FAD-dependent oxidoreductase [Desulfovibrio desulfuricans]MCB6552282.1 FAD-dependent oxidoreductase [Desulfovibrio desulfuricans]MCB6564125.1 FAD-dependent oxidoreductase [Desulfovibrio desulfuricans]MCB7345305.1 FAD-dependent oxidoreductase [Desulfovibrio desulfuricans]